MNPPYEITTPNRIKLNILGEAQNWRCAYCGIRCDGEQNAHNSATREHIVPKAVLVGKMYSADIWENEIMACAMCNNHRGAMWARQYYQMVQWKGREKAARWASRKHSKRMKAKITPAHSHFLDGQARSDTP